MPKIMPVLKRGFLVAIIAALALLNACKKDNETPSPEPEVFTNEFTINEYWKNLPIAWNEYDTDTITSKGVKLKGSVNGGSYIWNINGVAFTTQEIILDSILLDTLITVKYKVSKNGETDSLTRSFIRVSECQTLVNGAFTGKDNQSNTTRTVEIDTRTNCGIVRAKGLTGSCASNLLISVIGYRQVAFTSTTDPSGIGICFDPLGIAYYDNTTNEVKIQYNLRTSSTPNKEYVFTGSK